MGLSFPGRSNDMNRETPGRIHGSSQLPSKLRKGREESRNLVPSWLRIHRGWVRWNEEIGKSLLAARGLRMVDTERDVRGQSPEHSRVGLLEDAIPNIAGDLVVRSYPDVHAVCKWRELACRPPSSLLIDDNLSSGLVGCPRPDAVATRFHYSLLKVESPGVHESPYELE